MRIEIFHDIVNAFGNVSNKKENIIKKSAIMAAVSHMNTCCVDSRIVPASNLQFPTRLVISEKER